MDNSANRLPPVSTAEQAPPDIAAPASLERSVSETLNSTASTQDAFGRLLYRLTDQPEWRERIVTCSPDVSVSTNLAGWINKTGAFKLHEMPDYETDAQVAQVETRTERTAHRTGILR